MHDLGISGDHFLIIPPTIPSIATKPETEKRGEQKGIGICNAKRSECFIKVLCVNTELCANTGAEVRGDLKDSAVVA